MEEYYGIRNKKIDDYIEEIEEVLNNIDLSKFLKINRI